MSDFPTTLRVLVQAKDEDLATTLTRTVQLPFIPAPGHRICLAESDPDDIEFRCDDVVYDLAKGSVRILQFYDTHHFSEVVAAYASAGFVDDNPPNPQPRPLSGLATEG